MKFDFPKRHRRRGAALVTVFFLILISAILSLIMAQSLIDTQGLTSHQRERWRAFYLAEAGVAQVQQWALYPDEYTINPTLFQAAGASGTGTGTGTSGLVSVNANFQTRYPALYSAVNSGNYTISETELDTLGINTFTSSHDQGVGKIVEIVLLPPDPANDPIPSIFRIQSTGRSFFGVQRNLMGYAQMNPVMGIQIPAALISFDNIAVNGNVKVHWGEAWSKNNMRMESQNQYGYLEDDPYAIWRTEALINDWGGGWRVDTAKKPDILTSQDDMGVVDPYIGRFLQNQPTDSFPADWPEFDYQTFKDMAIAHGRYYTTDAAGNIYRDGVQDGEHLVNFLSEFGTGNQDAAPYDLVFIDTIDQNPPAADGSNLAGISISGNSLGIKGVFYIGANFDAAGVGSPPVLDATDPDGNAVQLSKIFLNGVMYTAGTVEMSGNAGVYGSVVTELGFAGTGTPDIYYNRELADGLTLGDGNVGSIFKITLQTNYGG